MSASPSLDAYDAQMLDFPSDPDVPMNITGSAEFFAEALMDHDGHLVASAYAEHAGVEVDMEEYVGDNAEYEMADETAEYQRPHRDEPLDIEVYDASHVPSPLVPLQPLQPPVDVTIGSEHTAPTSPAFSDHIAIPEVRAEPGSEVHPPPLDHPSADAPHVEPSALGEAVSSEVGHSTNAPGESIPPVSESHEQLGDTAHTDGQPFETPAPAAAAKVELVPPVAVEHPTSSEMAQHENPEPPTAESAPLVGAENTYDSGPPVPDEKAAEQAPLTERETDPLHISDGVYIDPPPAVLLSIADLSEPGFALFNQPDVEGESTEALHGDQKAFSLLLDDRPTLYYEPLSSVFEALRQLEGLLSRVPHSFEGELVLDAYDLQLAVSEDNVHSREISLHDLNILHDGSDFVGPLRLLLRATVPRFIIRYYAVQEQVQRLNLAAETGEGEHDEDHHEHYDTGEEKPQPPQDKSTRHTSPPTPVVSAGSPTKAEEPAKEPVLPPEPTETTPPDNYEPGDTPSIQEPAAEYHEVTGETTHALVDDDGYEGTDAGDEDESSKFERLDADQVHDTAAKDTDTSATVTGQGSELGGEQTEYFSYVQPEEYDERYGEDLLERAGAASPVQYGELPHYEEDGEQKTSTTLDETHVNLPSEDEDAEDQSTATPIPVRTVLEPESSELAGDNVPGALAPPEQVKLVPSKEEVAISKSTNEIDHKLQALGNRETTISQAKVFSEANESDSNFVSILEREADAEFERTFNPEQSGQEGSIEATLQQDETWDEWDDEDAEGEDEEDWIDPEAASNESSTTLSSKVSSKRSYEEVDPSAEVYVEDPRNSPGPKRPRVL